MRSTDAAMRLSASEYGVMSHTTRFQVGLYLLAGTLAGLSGSVAAGTGRLAEVEVYDRTSGQVLPVYWHQGRHHIAGQPGHEYEVRIRSRDGSRLLAVTSVDGVNVITGQTASPTQSGYVIEPYGNQGVAGWRKNMERTAAFYFTALPDSYAARTGRPDDVGVIGVALFRESRPQPRPWRDDAIAAGSPREQAAQGAPRASRAERAAGEPSLSSAPEAQSKLGTGHGRSEWSNARYTTFQRRSDRPDEVVTLYYDSYRNLVAQGIAPADRRWHGRHPQAFPGGFVPDP